MKTTAINQQTAGPLTSDTELSVRCSFAPHIVFRSELRGYETRKPIDDECEANARLLTVSYTAFDKAARTLGVDAAELAGAIDLAGLVGQLHDLVDRFGHNDSPEDLEELDRARALLAKLPKAST